MERPSIVHHRFSSLDYLRGAMALAVLAFHYDKWLTGTWDANTLQGRLGIYAVSIFFILSGLTLTLVYETRLNSTFQSWTAFFRKRFFRIFPLLWMATAATLLLDDAPRKPLTILLNFSGLFGIVNPARDIATGAWSIGCELVFYTAFPTLLLLAKRSKMAFMIVFAALFSVGIWIAFAWYYPTDTQQSVWWPAYVQAANHAFFFVGGMVLAVFRHKLSLISPNFWYILFAAAILGFAYLPIGSEAFYLVSGWNRVVLSTLSLLLVAAFFFSKIEFKGWWHRSFVWLGAISYSLYLLHPLVYRTVQFGWKKLGISDGYWSTFLPALMVSLVLSHLSYFFIEKPISRKK